jgi:hypothetical protein
MHFHADGDEAWRRSSRCVVGGDGRRSTCYQVVDLGLTGAVPDPVMTTSFSRRRQGACWWSVGHEHHGAVAALEVGGHQRRRRIRDLVG